MRRLLKARIRQKEGNQKWPYLFISSKLANSFSPVPKYATVDENSKAEACYFQESILTFSGRTHGIFDVCPGILSTNPSGAFPRMPPLPPA
jgi:hypothetical protein